MKLKSMILFLLALFLDAYANAGTREALLTSFKVGVPEFSSVTFGENDVEDEKYLITLIEGICDYEKSESKTNQSSDIIVYQKILKNLKPQGLYNERLLRDLVTKIIIDYSISSILKDQVKSAKETISFLEGQIPSDIALRQLLVYYKKEKKNNQLSLDDLNQFDLILGGDLTKASTKSLMQTKDETVLSKRILYCDFIYEYYLKGIIVFLNKKGEFDKLNIADNTYFKKIMKGETISYPNFGMMRFRNSNLISFLDLVQNKEEWELINYWLKS